MLDNNNLQKKNDKKNKNGLNLIAKYIKKINFKQYIILFFVSIFLLIFSLFWQNKFSLMAICNGLWLVFGIEFAYAWILFVYSNNVLSSLIYGVKSFGFMLVGKRPKKSYFEYMYDIENNPIPSTYYRPVFITSFIVLIPALITLFILI